MVTAPGGKCKIKPEPGGFVFYSTGGADVLWRQSAPHIMPDGEGAAVEARGLVEMVEELACQELRG